jgi:ABC-type polysaccharide/polyol phosphate export permease
MTNSLQRNFQEVRQYRDVLAQLVRQFLTLRYRRTILGYLWTLLNPLLMMSVTAVVFATLFNQDLVTYSIFLFAGMVPWTFFATTVSQSCTAFINNEGLIKKIYLPKIIFPLSLTIGILIDSALSLLALFVLILLFGAPISWALLFIPIAYLLLLFFALGVALVMAVATVFFRDLQYVISVVIQAWFFLTPVMYKHESLTGKVAWLVALNPMVPFIELFRAPLQLGKLPSVTAITASSIFAASSIILGLCVFLYQEKKLVFRL